MGAELSGNLSQCKDNRPILLSFVSTIRLPHINLTFAEAKTVKVRSSFAPGDKVRYELRLTIPNEANGKKATVSLKGKLKVGGIRLPFNALENLSGPITDPEGDAIKLPYTGTMTGTFFIPKRMPSSELLVTVTPKIDGVGKHTAHNVNSTWTQAGLLTGRARKFRSQPSATAGAVAYALLLAHVTGQRGEHLFSNEYMALLDCSHEQALTLAEDASRRGWIVLMRIGKVIEFQFPALLTAEDQDRLREQN